MDKFGRIVLLLPGKPVWRVGLLKLFATLLQLSLFGVAFAGEFGYCDSHLSTLLPRIRLLFTVTTSLLHMRKTAAIPKHQFSVQTYFPIVLK